jgi:hypothetical protein
MHMTIFYPASPVGRRGAGRQLVAVAALLSLSPALSGAASKTYTLNADFTLGTLENLNFSAVPDQLQVNLVGVGSRFIFVANHDEDSVSKFDTTDQFNASGVLTAPGKEVARYKTYAGRPGVGAGGQPSRIAIDVDGNAYVLNRMSGIGAPPFLTKILVDSAIDRNSNGVVDTSAEVNGIAGIQPAEMLPLSANTNAALQDERVAWIRSVGTGTSFGRSVCIAPDGKLWVGIWNQARYYRVDPATGDTLPIPGTGAAYVQLSGWNPYGCTVDKAGILWSASLVSGLGKVDTNTGIASLVGNPYSGYNYGIAQGSTRIYQAPYAGGYGWAAYNPTTHTWARSPDSYNGSGIAIDGEGNILTTDYSGIRKYNGSTGALMWAKSEGGTTYGVMIDGNNDVWVMNLGFNRTTKYRGTTGALVGFLPTGAYPYVYTDGSGLTTKNLTVNKLGTWTVVQDGGATGKAWGQIKWNDAVPAGASVEVFARAADDPAAFDFQAYVPVAKGARFAGTGRYLQVRTRLQMNAANETPLLYDLTVNSAEPVCDVDGNGVVDRTDIGLVRAAIGLVPVAGDVRDANGDGKITINDVRACTLRCTNANCVP